MCGVRMHPRANANMCVVSLKIGTFWYIRVGRFMCIERGRVWKRDGGRRSIEKEDQICVSVFDFGVEKLELQDDVLTVCVKLARYLMF